MLFANKKNIFIFQNHVQTIFYGKEMKLVEEKTAILNRSTGSSTAAVPSKLEAGHFIHNISN